MAHYEGKYHEFVHGNLIKIPNYYLFRAKYSKKNYLKYLKGKILEFGSGLSQNIFLIKDTAEGIDVSDFSIDFSKKKGIKVTKDIKKLKANSFDSVLSIHCLEHLENPFDYIKEFYRVLKPSGRLLIVLPTQTKNKPTKNFKPNIGKHLYGWNFNHINELLNSAKFKIKLNKFNYAYGFSFFYKFSFPLANSLIQLFGKIRNKKEMIILVEK
ncbi:MAG: hypothetical protein CMH62_02515 [Nanoarchaeota archaeon]|nr:hypothetical protein [Nanoarchaeota archaeon]